MIFLIPIEPYEERYTEQWSRWWPEAMSDLDEPYWVIQGEALRSVVKTGKVLDACGTNHYKATQLATIMRMIDSGQIGNGDRLWFHDLWFPGIEAIAYVRNMTNLTFTIEGVLHAGTWDNHDFTYQAGMEPWAKHIENGWLEFIDRIYLGSTFHQTLLTEKREVEISKTQVTGLPFVPQEVDRHTAKENIVVFPHRMDNEKRPDLFRRLANDLQPDFPDWKFLFTKEQTATKEEYLRLLGRSRIAVSFAQQETFGYAMLEAIANRCVPIVPDDLSYATMPIYTGYRCKGYADTLCRVRTAIEQSEGPHGSMNSMIGYYRPSLVIRRML
jgi:hypothetical protein